MNIKKGIFINRCSKVFIGLCMHGSIFVTLLKKEDSVLRICCMFGNTNQNVKHAKRPRTIRH